MSKRRPPLKRLTEAQTSYRYASARPAAVDKRKHASRIRLLHEEEEEESWETEKGTAYESS